MKRVFYRLLAVLLILAALPVYGGAAKKPRDEKQEAVVRTMLAYYYRGYGVQYDSGPITAYGKYDGGPIRGGYTFSPEDATEDNICFSVCSDFALQVYCEDFGWILMGDILNCKCKRMVDLAHKDPENPMIVFYYTPPEPTGVSRKDLAAALDRAREVYEPGDVVVQLNGKGTGHTMLFGGDVFGDGSDYFIHCNGEKYDMTTGKDDVETLKNADTGFGGAIRADRVEDFIDRVANKKTELAGGTFEVIVLRPLNVLQSTPLTANAKARLQYDKLDIDRRADCDRYLDVAQGEDLTVTLTLTNHSKAAYTVPVTQIVPANATLKQADGATVNGDTLTWSVALSPETPKTITYTLTATGPRGSIIDLTGGSVGGIRDNDIPVLIGGRHLSAEQEKALSELESRKREIDAKKYSGSAFATAVYRDVLGLNVAFAPVGDYTKQFCDKELIPGVGTMYRPKTVPEGPAAAMRIPHYYGGQYVLTDDSRDRALTFEPAHLRPGDVILYSNSNTKDGAYIYLGDNRAATVEDGTLLVRKADEALLKMLTYSYFQGFRPTLAYDDIHAATDSLPFTDVKAGDWYYEFVKELYEKKIVSGMTATTFVPNGKLTYGQALKLIVVGLGNPEQASTGGNWASGYLAFAKNQKWLDKDVDLNGAISRLQFCQIAAKAKNLTAQPAANPFKDCADKDVLALVNAGIVGGMTADTFAPDSTLTRAQISKIISGLIK